MNNDSMNLMVGDVVVVSGDVESFDAVVTSVEVYDDSVTIDYAPIGISDDDAEVIHYGPAILANGFKDMGDVEDFGYSSEDFDFPCWQHGAFDGTVVIQIVKKEN